MSNVTVYEVRWYDSAGKLVTPGIVYKLKHVHGLTTDAARALVAAAQPTLTPIRLPGATYEPRLMALEAIDLPEVFS